MTWTSTKEQSIDQRMEEAKRKKEQNALDAEIERHDPNAPKAYNGGFK
ncbi:MAG: hypothetical protein U9N52_03730 [Campylobacterota bacterium]|nr:hypothetical protein [Campylobacterota bacterium]